MNTNQLWLTVGLPRSGKSTWARTQGHPIVSPDAIRLALYGERFKPEGETMVWAIARYMVESLFNAGHQIVILDATNLIDARRREWLSSKWETLVHVVPTSPEICKERALACGQDDLVPVIDRMLATMEPPLSPSWQHV